VTKKTWSRYSKRRRGLLDISIGGWAGIKGREARWVKRLKGRRK
jgi:hypothetical protein